MTLKLDMSKSYDRVEWGCLDTIMEKLGFHSKWRELMMQCITSVTYSVRINGSPQGRIIPSLGLCQRDPLSPYLFLICVEGLLALIKKSVSKGLLEGILICRRDPVYLTYFFANPYFL